MKVSYQKSTNKSYPQLDQLEDGSVFRFANDADETPYILIKGDAMDNIYTDCCSIIEDCIIKAECDGSLSFSTYRPILTLNGVLFFTSRFNEVIPLNATMVIKGEE